MVCSERFVGEILIPVYCVIFCIIMLYAIILVSSFGQKKYYFCKSH